MLQGSYLRLVSNPQALAQNVYYHQGSFDKVLANALNDGDESDDTGNFSSLTPTQTALASCKNQMVVSGCAALLLGGALALRVPTSTLLLPFGIINNYATGFFSQNGKILRSSVPPLGAAGCAIYAARQFTWTGGLTDLDNRKDLENWQKLARSLQKEHSDASSFIFAFYEKMRGRNVYSLEGGPRPMSMSDIKKYDLFSIGKSGPDAALYKEAAYIALEHIGRAFEEVQSLHENEVAKLKEKFGVEKEKLQATFKEARVAEKQEQTKPLQDVKWTKHPQDVNRTPAEERSESLKQREQQAMSRLNGKHERLLEEAEGRFGGARSSLDKQFVQIKNARTSFDDPSQL